MTALFSNIHVWILIASIVFFLLFFKKIKVAIIDFLNSKISNIQLDIKQSEETLSSALLLLNETKKNSEELKARSSKSLIKARTSADSYYEQSSAKLNLNLKINKQAFKNYLVVSEAKVTKDINENIVNTSARNVVNILSTKLSVQDHLNLIDESIENFGSFISSGKK